MKVFLPHSSLLKAKDWGKQNKASSDFDPKRNLGSFSKVHNKGYVKSLEIKTYRNYRQGDAVKRGQGCFESKAFKPESTGCSFSSTWAEQQAAAYSWDALITPAVSLFEVFPLCKGDKLFMGAVN